MVAAAKNYTVSRKSDKTTDSKVRPGEEWQRAAWDFFDMIPEYHQGCAVTGALLSRAKLVPLERDANGAWVATTNPVVVEALDELFGGEEGQTEMLRQFGIHLSVAGEGWLVGPAGGDADDWIVAASTEVSRSGGKWKVGGKEIKGSPLVLRIFKRHPRDPKKADAPTRAILPVLSELHQLTKRIAAQIDSRLFGAGLLLVPSETSFPATPTRVTNVGEDPVTTRDSVQPGDAQGLADLLFETAQQAIQSPESAAAMLPVIGSAPGEYIGNVKHITFWSELDRTAPRLREELIRRIALGLDIPAEVLLGHAGSNHWNAWLSDENSVKIHAEPLLKVITSGLTTQYLRLAIDTLVDNPENFAIGADTSQMRLRPNRSKEALELNDRLILSDDAVLRENGFVEGDRMPEEDMIKALIRKVASGSTTPELVEAALREAGVNLDVQITDVRPPAEARPTPSLREHPVRELPERIEGAAALPATRTGTAEQHALTLVAEQIVDRALQRAGNRIKSKMGLRNVETPANRLYLGVTLGPKDVDDVLQDAWSACHEFDYGVSGKDLARALDLYTRSLMLAQREPTRASIASALKLLLNRSAA